MRTVYTIGHSTHSIEAFLALLQGAGVAAIADVRSSPYSRRQPQFNRETLRSSLDQQGIAYVFLGSELGGRGNDDSVCDELGRVRYKCIAESARFDEGLKRVLAGSERMRLALMCAENDPLYCHRGILISKVLAAQGTSVLHIHANGLLETHSAAETRLLHLTSLYQPDLFRTEDQILTEAYERQEARIAYVMPNVPAVSQVVR